MRTKLVYVGPFDRVEYPQTAMAFKSDRLGWAEANRGDTVEVDVDVAESLLEQPDNWQPAKPKTATKTTKTTEGED